MARAPFFRVSRGDFVGYGLSLSWGEKGFSACYIYLVPSVSRFLLGAEHEVTVLNHLPCVTVRDFVPHSGPRELMNLQFNTAGVNCRRRLVLVGLQARRASGKGGTPGGI